MFASLGIPTSYLAVYKFLYKRFIIIIDLVIIIIIL